MILCILSFSTFIPALAYAEPLANEAKDWHYVNGNSWAWNYSPQTQITKDNVEQIEVKWIFPVQAKATAVQGLQVSGSGVNEGSTTPPIVNDGIVYILSNFMRLYAVDAKTGKQLWTSDYKIDIEETSERIPITFGRSIHLHGFEYWEGGDAILYNGMACDFVAVDAKTGEDKFWVQDLCVDISGNLYNYQGRTISQPSIGIYEKGHQFIYVLPGSMHSTIFGGDARHVTLGIDMDTHQIQWRVFSFPPYDVPSKDWALQECDIGFFQDIPCSEVAAQAPENLEWDWAQPGEPPSMYGGVTANWGQLVVDEDTGILYTQTGNQGPYTYIGDTPGPRLYGSTIMAIDIEEGERIWWVQTFPRDPYDYDTCWSGILADVPGLGKVYMKGGKEGRLYVMDAATGEPHYVVDIVDEQYEWGQIGIEGATPTPNGIKYHLNDPFDYYDMREMESPDNSKYCGRPCEVYPAWLNGVFATDKSYDPETGTLYHYAAALQISLIESPPSELGKSVSIASFRPKMNSTIVARDIKTGEVKWTWFYAHDLQRSHMVITPELLFTGFTDGYVRFFDKDTGELLRELNLGSDLMVGLTTGQDVDGNQMIFTMGGVGRSLFTPFNPGFLVALGLSERAAGEVRTTTVTTTSISRTTVTTTSATTRTVTSATTSTVTSSVTSTIVSTASAITTTVTSEVTEEVGLPAEITYAAVAVAVIAIIAAAVLMMRKK